MEGGGGGKRINGKKDKGRERCQRKDKRNALACLKAGDGDEGAYGADISVPRDLPCRCLAVSVTAERAAGKKGGGGLEGRQTQQQGGVSARRRVSASLLHPSGAELGPLGA
eukprot:3235814-Rhodomonas_salina.6